MKCKYCGCNEGKPCLGGCGWAFPGVCTNCVLVPHNIKESIEAYLTDPEVICLELMITREKQKKKEGFLIIK